MGTDFRSDLDSVFPGSNGILAAGQALRGTLGVLTLPTFSRIDRDGYRIDVTAGVTYRIALDGEAAGAGRTALFDPVLMLIGADGTSVLAENDNAGRTRNAYLEYTATVDATLFLVARAAVETRSGRGDPPLQPGDYVLRLWTDTTRRQRRSAPMATTP
jgi:hypothetical protein